jgi:hypothetical protein
MYGAVLADVYLSSAARTIRRVREKFLDRDGAVDKCVRQSDGMLGPSG